MHVSVLWSDLGKLVAYAEIFAFRALTCLAFLAKAVAPKKCNNAFVESFVGGFYGRG